MEFKPMNNFFIVRISKVTQKERQEKIGSLYLHPQHVYMTRGCQSAQIVAIGKGASSYFPEAQIGDAILFSHFIEGKKDNKGYPFYFIADDVEYNYYGVNGVASEGERNMVYAIWNGTDLIPNKDYVFLDKEKEAESDLAEYSMPMMMSAGGLVIPKPRKKTRQEMIAQMEKNKAKIFRISNERLLAFGHVKEEIRKLEQENNQISKEINRKAYEPMKVAAFNAVLKDSIPNLARGTTVYTLNIASLYIIEFMAIEYIVVPTEYVGLAIG